MIVQEQISETLVRTYSDSGFYIFGGMPEGNYSEAIDPIDLHRTYIETDIPIEDEEKTIEEWPEWIQPKGTDDGYNLDDRVSHNDFHWISAIDNNVWEPGGAFAEGLWIKQ